MLIQKHEIEELKCISIRYTHFLTLKHLPKSQHNQKPLVLAFILIVKDLIIVFFNCF